MNVMVANVLNSCLIEETRIRIPAADQGILNNSNLRTDTRYFKDNLGKNDIVNKLPFTKWMMACPMLNCFLDEETYGKVQTFVSDAFKIDRGTYPVYELLCKINSKVVTGNNYFSKPPFSGAKNPKGKEDGWKETVAILHNNGIDDDTIHEKIIREENIANIVSFINELGLFRSAQENSIKSFKNNYCLEQVAVEEEPTNNDEISKDGNE